MANLVGRDVGRYHLVEKFGEGGMATVYKAYDTRLDRHVAVKVIAAAQQHAPDFLKRFEREAKALARLSHPHIVNVHDYGEQDGAPYLVMEFLPGGTLKKVMGKPVPFNEAAKLLSPVARALEYAHQRNIIHRDVKPANILMTESGMPMLTDFGIAKMLEKEQTTALTGVGVGIGTPEYMSPEQGQGLPVDQRADIYALGVVLFELVTGRKPYQADTPMAIVLKSMSEPLPRPQSFVPGIPDEVEKAIFKAMAKKPQDRFQDMGAFANALEKLSQLTPDDQATVRQPKGQDDVATVVYTDPLSYDSMPAPTTPQAPSTPSFAPQPVPPTYQTMPPAPQKKKKGWFTWVLIGGVVLLLVLCGGGLLLGGGLVAIGMGATVTPQPTYAPFASSTPVPTFAPQATIAPLPTEVPVPDEIPQDSAVDSYIPFLDATVTDVRFFEGPYGGGDHDLAVYDTSFPQSSTRYVFIEYHLEHSTHDQRIDFTYDVVLHHLDGERSLFSHDTYLDPSWATSYHYKGFGWAEPGGWTPGEYLVNIYIGDQKIVSQTFEIYQD